MSRSSSSGSGTATMCRSSKRSSQRGLVVDTMEIAGTWRALPEIYERTTAAMRAVEHTLVASAHQSHSYTDGGCLYFTFAGRPPAEQREAYYRAVWDAGQGAVLAAGGALSHHHGVGLNRARFVREALGPAFDVLQTVKNALDPSGILNPGKLGLAHRRLRVGAGSGVAERPDRAASGRHA